MALLLVLLSSTTEAWMTPMTRTKTTATTTRTTEVSFDGKASPGQAPQESHWDKLLTTTTTATAAMWTLSPLVAMADDASSMEYAELPPPYVPVAFGLLLLVGVGALTGSLGNVLDEEASLGLQSGARAKKEQERARSSYFKNK